MPSSSTVLAGAGEDVNGRSHLSGKHWADMSWWVLWVLRALAFSRPCKLYWLSESVAGVCANRAPIAVSFLIHRLRVFVEIYHTVLGRRWVLHLGTSTCTACTKISEKNTTYNFE